MNGQLSIGFVAGLFVCGLALLLSGGCTSTPSAALYQAIGTDKAALTATTTLYQAGRVDKADAKAVLASVVSAEAGLHVWDQVLQTKSTGNIQTAEAAANAALAAILQQLQNLQVKNPTTRAALAMPKVRYSAPGPARSISAGDAITLVELAVELAPQIESWVNQFLNTTTVTEDQIAQAFSDLDVAITTARAVIGG